MDKIKLRSDLPVDLVQHSGNDHSVVWAARISTGRDDVLKGLDESGIGLIRYLMREKHGTPFEHNSMTFRIEAPIFVWREFHRHRIGFSYNEQSGRYTEFKPEFYLPNANRPLAQEGKPGAYKLVVGENHIEQWNSVSSSFYAVCQLAYGQYKNMLDKGITREVACRILPTTTYSSCYVTCNARSLMSFLSLRMAPNAQWEIRQVANSLYAWFTELFPQVSAAYKENGYIAP